MPPARPILILLAFVALPTFLTFFSLLSAHSRGSSATDSAPSQRGAIRSFFSFHTPSTLFPPSAIISLTDDNSTFFLSRPADFGPRLVSDGLSGQLWVGSGFGDDNMRKGGAATGPEGELGCSDVPGWEHGDQQRHGDVSFSQSRYLEADTPSTGVTKANLKQNLDESTGRLSDKHDLSEPTNLGGTDDHLHFPLPDSQVSKPGQPQFETAVGEGHLPGHADIQSLQETAEITGKIVLLSRGGCGFLEKVKWAQRRGAAALIVGDDTRGGALVTMYARGDTSNVTIPSLFTSHTTAHLLSSLIPPEGSGDDDDFDISADTESNDGAKSRIEVDEDRPTFTAALKEIKPTSTTSARRVSVNSRSKASPYRKKVSKTIRSIRKRTVWQKLGFGKEEEAQGLGEDSRRPPSSGRLSWVNEKFNDELVLAKRNSDTHRSKDPTSMNSRVSTKSQHNSRDGFEIGIQDWRDPDLVATKSSESKDGHKTSPTIVVSTSAVSGGSIGQESGSTANSKKAFAGGSITPGSGEYNHNPSDLRTSHSGKYENNESDRDNDGWLSHALWGDDSEIKADDDDDLQSADFLQNTASYPSSKNLPAQSSKTPAEQARPDEEHDGLWVTLTPTTMSTTPFFDTLLVLVVSPLITLTVVYALLLLRSRIRRRRWRAPKSVVERLPVRTYQTMPMSSTTSSTRMASPFASSPTSPLMQSRSQSIHSRSRAQSKVGSETSDILSVSLDKAAAQAAAKQAENEKSARATAVKKKYKGRQVECVVCLEEYVEGHSQVMSLPCGHEFHAECITPWLTTRRRTCPICKNDVVRSMARSSTSVNPSSSSSPHHDTSENNDNVQTLAAETANESPSAAIPIPRETNDLERGDDMADTLVEDQSGRRGWRGLASFSLSAFSGEAAWRQAQADRDR